MMAGYRFQNIIDTRLITNCQNMTVRISVKRFPVPVTHHSASAINNRSESSIIVNVQARLTNHIDMAAGDQSVIIAITAIDNLARRNFAGKPHEVIGIMLVKQVRRGGGKHRVLQIAATRGLRPYTVKHGWPAHDSQPAFPRNRLVNNPDDRPAFLHKRNQSAENRTACDKAGRAVDGIEHPLARSPFVYGAIFFADNPVVGAKRFDNFSHRSFGSAVRFGDGRGIAFGFLIEPCAEKWPDGLTGGVGKLFGKGYIFGGHG